MDGWLFRRCWPSTTFIPRYDEWNTRYGNRKQEPRCSLTTSCTQRNLNDSECTSRGIIAVECNKILPNPYLSSHHSDHLLLHHHRSLSRVPQKTRSTLTRGLRIPLLKFWMAPNCSPVRRAMRNSPSGAGRTPRLSTTGRGGSTGTWRDGARTVARSATAHDGVGKDWRTTPRRGSGTWTNQGWFELAGGQCYEFHIIRSHLFPSMRSAYDLLHVFIVSYSSFHFDWSCASKAALVNMQHDFHYLHTACRQHDDLVAASLYTTFTYKLLFKP